MPASSTRLLHQLVFPGILLLAMGMRNLGIPDALFAELLLLRHACQIVFQVLVLLLKIRHLSRVDLSTGFGWSNFDRSDSKSRRQEARRGRGEDFLLPAGSRHCTLCGKDDDATAAAAVTRAARRCAVPWQWRELWVTSELSSSARGPIILPAPAVHGVPSCRRATGWRSRERGGGRTAGGGRAASRNEAPPAAMGRLYGWGRRSSSTLRTASSAAGWAGRL
jgi:hypothetical protein